IVSDYGKHKLSFEPGAKPTVTIPNSIGHHAEWLKAIRDKTGTTCNFDYSGGLTEAVLLGNVAYRAEAELNWNAETLSPNQPKAEEFLNAPVRSGWAV
ncbi:MAG: gfo/Idh/MocA family oxidoreductase, partial [Gemmataceae bacterium]